MQHLPLLDDLIVLRLLFGRISGALNRLSPDEISTLEIDPDLLKYLLKPKDFQSVDLLGTWPIPITGQITPGPKGASATDRGQRTLLQAVFEADPGGLAVLVGPDLRFSYVNPAYRFLCPDPQVDPLGKIYDQVWANAGHFPSGERFRQVLETGQPFQKVGVEYDFYDGTKRIFTLQARRIEWDEQPACLLILWDTTMQENELRRRIAIEAELKRTKEEYQLLVENQVDMVARMSRDGRRLYVNPRFLEMVGKTAEEVLDTEYSPEIHPDDRARVAAEWQKTFQPPEYRSEIEARTKTVEGWRTFSWRNRAIIDENGEPSTAISVGRDITERKQIEKALQESERSEKARAVELETLMDTVPAFVWVSHDPECREMTSNRYGYDFLQAVPGSNISLSAPEGEAPSHYRAMKNGQVIPAQMMPMQVAARTGRPQYDFEFDFIFNNGARYTVYGNAEPLFNPEGQPSGAIGVFIDITQLKRAGKETQKLTAENEIKQRLIEQREQERLQIARDLHDGPMQELLGAIYALEGLKSMATAEDLALGLEEVMGSLQRQLDELRSYAGELRPPALGQFGLEKAMAAHMEAWQEKHPEIRVKYTCGQAEGPLPEAFQLPLFRIFQEILNNIVKHAQASEVAICLENNPAGVTVLTVTDNGQGFVAPENWLSLARAGHLGLVGMRERTEAIGGRLEVNSTPGQGTSIRVSIPGEP